MVSAGVARYSWVIAVVICIIASTISNFGLNLQKLALNMKAGGRTSVSKYRIVWFCGASR